MLIAAGVDVNRCETCYGAPPFGWVAHGSMYHRNPSGNYAACAEALILAGARVPRGTNASDEVMAVVNRFARRKRN